MQFKSYNKITYNNTPINPIKEYAEVKSSQIHGLGLFAKKLIPKKTIFWHARPQDVLIMTKDQFLILDASNKSPLMNNYIHCILTYSYYEKDTDTLVFCLDDSRYINHSSNANSGTSKDEPGFCAIADRDIHLGEEITEDYSTYKSCLWLKKYTKFSTLHCW
ncbi:MAG: SET domain-containing protein [Candidatus Lokiarchaeota archaeon]|nr:SET domain-containing protein [Candidatus Lokiarchaeota archaeon]